MKYIYASNNAAEAHIIRHYLEDNGVMVYIHGEFLQGAIGGIDVHNHIKLSVIDAEYEQARTLLKQWKEKSPEE